MKSDMPHPDTPQPDEQIPAAHAQVLIRSIGGIAAAVRGAAAIWKGHSLGEPQLKAMLSYTIARVGQAIHRDDLAGVGSRDPKKQPTRPSNLASGLLNMLKSWGMGCALKLGWRTITLERHACWSLDTDMIDEALGIATRYRRAGDVVAERAILQQAASHCGGVYLDGFDAPDDVFDCGLEDKRHYWERRQRDLLHRLIRLQLQQSAYDEALAGARLLDQLAADNQADYLLIAEVHDCQGGAQLAQFYRIKAQQADSLGERRSLII